MGGRLYPRRFALVRHIDYTGVSGVGVVAYGVVFFDGHVALRWRSDHPATSLWNSIDDLLAVHGHGDGTSVQWIDDLGGRLQEAAESSDLVRGRRARRTPLPDDGPTADPQTGTTPPPPPPEENELPPWPGEADVTHANPDTNPMVPPDEPGAPEVPMVPPQRRPGGRHRRSAEPSEESAGHR
jgi:hypothetical protein